MTEITEEERLRREMAALDSQRQKVPRWEPNRRQQLTLKINAIAEQLGVDPPPSRPNI